MDFSETAAGGIHSSRRESKSAEKKIENRTATDKRKMKHIITSLKVPLCSSLKKCIVGKQGWDSGIWNL